MSDLDLVLAKLSHGWSITNLPKDRDSEVWSIVQKMCSLSSNEVLCLKDEISIRGMLKYVIAMQLLNLVVYFLDQ